MYILSIITLVLSIFLLAITGQTGLSGAFRFFDVVSMLAIIVTFIPMMAASGLFKDFNNAFKLTIGKKKEESILELKKAKDAVKFAGKLFIITGIITSLIGFIMASYDCTNVRSFMVNMSVALLTIFYGLVFYICLLPIQVRLEIKISEFMQM